MNFFVALVHCVTRKDVFVLCFFFKSSFRVNHNKSLIDVLIVKKLSAHKFDLSADQIIQSVRG